MLYFQKGHPPPPHKTNCLCPRCSKKASIHKSGCKCFRCTRNSWLKGTKGLIGANAGSFSKGHQPWNKNLKGYKLIGNFIGKKGEDNPSWKGDKVGYSGLHKWVFSQLGRPNKCEHCNKITVTQWANKSHEYKRDLNDWLALCRDCHIKYDEIGLKISETKQMKKKILFINE